jgi:uncharacterized phage-like protein YoqJ
MSELTPISHKKIAVTGHRPDKLGGYDENNPTAAAIKRHMRAFLLKPANRPEMAITGMALGIDQWWAEACIELDIPFTAAIPFDGFHVKWLKESQDRFNRIMREAEAIVYVSAPGYEPWKMQRRNEWMVDFCTELVAYWDGSEGGTNNCVRYALTKGKPHVIFHPRMIQ